MATEKIAITMDKELLREIDHAVKTGQFRSRSRAIQDAVKEKLEQHKRGRLLAEAKKLDPNEEKALAEEGVTGEEAEWPEY